VNFVVVKPETAGYPVSFRPITCRFDTWLGDDIVRAHPLLLVTSRLSQALQRLSGNSGFSLALIKVSSSPFFRREHPGRRLPRFWRMVVNGEPGKDDMGMLADHSLVVSLRVVQTLLGFSMREATMYQYRPQPGAPPRTVEKRRRLSRGGE
jgi:hypothetical protein